MDFLAELRWRGMLHDLTPGVEEELAKGPATGYIGFDPTAPSLTIGNYVQIMLLTFFQKTGNTPIILLGGATGKIGDPSFKSEERALLEERKLKKNLLFQQEQMRSLLLKNGLDPEKAKFVNNNDFYSNMRVLRFLRDVGKSITVSYMMSKDSVKNRLETGLSFTEFSYQLLQGYDFQYLYQHQGCTVQMGGSDQWGNITTGVEFVRRNLGAKVYAVTTPLLTKADGSKFGKSEKGNLWLDAELTTPYEFYQFWINSDDADLPKYLRYFTLKNREEVESLEAEHTSDPRRLKEILAEEITTRVHSPEACRDAQKVSRMLFDKKADRDELFGLSPQALRMIARTLDSQKVPPALFAAPLALEDLLTEHSQLLPSRSEFRRAVKGGAISVNKIKVSDAAQQVGAEDLIQGRYLMVENGKKNKHFIEIAN